MLELGAPRKVLSTNCSFVASGTCKVHLAGAPSAIPSAISSVLPSVIPSVILEILAVVWYEVWWSVYRSIPQCSRLLWLSTLYTHTHMYLYAFKHARNDT